MLTCHTCAAYPVEGAGRVVLEEEQEQAAPGRSVDARLSRPHDVLDLCTLTPDVMYCRLRQHLSDAGSALHAGLRLVLQHAPDVRSLDLTCCSAVTCCKDCEDIVLLSIEDVAVDSLVVARKSLLTVPRRVNCLLASVSSCL